MILQKKTINNVPTLVPLTADTGSGVPVGTIIGQYKKVNMSGYLYLDGSTFDQTLYPALYAYLGTNVLPDYREFVLVGAEQNTTSATIADHDVFTQGQEKDDQLQEHTHRKNANWGNFTTAIFPAGTDGQTAAEAITFGNVYNARVGTTTRTKEKAVFWYIKATTGIIESEATEMLNVFNNRMFPDYTNRLSISGSPWTAPEDVYVVYSNANQDNQGGLTIDGVLVSTSDNDSGRLPSFIHSFSGYVRKGQILNGGGLASPQNTKVFTLTN